MDDKMQNLQLISNINHIKGEMANLMNVKKEYRIHSYFLPVDDYQYCVETWRSIDDGKTWVYTGEMKQFNTKDDALNYIKSLES